MCRVYRETRAALDSNLRSSKPMLEEWISCLESFFKENLQFWLDWYKRLVFQPPTPKLQESFCDTSYQLGNLNWSNTCSAFLPNTRCIRSSQRNRSQFLESEWYISKSNCRLRYFTHNLWYSPKQPYNALLLPWFSSSLPRTSPSFQVPRSFPNFNLKKFQKTTSTQVANDL